MASGDARPVPRKNVAYRLTFPILDADGDLVTGAASLDSEISLDGAAFADVTAEATEIATSSGMYFLDLTTAEMNADTVAIIVKTATAGAKTTPIVIYPEEVGDYRISVPTNFILLAISASGVADANVKEWLGAAPNVLIAGRVDSNMQALADGVLTAAKFAAGAFDAVWTVATRTLTSFGTLVADVATAVWAAATRTLTAFGFTADANLVSVNGQVAAAGKLERSSRTIVLGTVAAGATQTVIPTSSLVPAAAVAGQFNGRVVIFDETTATTTLRGTAATIASSSAGGTLTILAAETLPTAPASGDTFVIV